MDAEKGDEGHKVTVVKSHKLKRVFTPKKIIIGSVLLICTLAVMFGMGVLAARYGMFPSPYMLFERALTIQSLRREQSRRRLRRGEASAFCCSYSCSRSS